MGVLISNKKIPIRKFELEELHKLTQFSPELVILFYSYYQKFSNTLKDDGVIDYSEFLLSLNLKDNIFSKHLFSGFDLNKDNFINFREFLKFFGIFQNGNPFNKIEICFRLFSNSNTKQIEKEMLINILNEAVNMNETLSNFVTLDDVENIVSETFRKYDKIITESYNINNNSFSNVINSREDEIEINHSRTTNYVSNNNNLNNNNNNFFFNNFHNKFHNNNILNLNSSKGSGITNINNKNNNNINNNNNNNIKQTGTFFLGNNINNNNNNKNENTNSSYFINLSNNNNNNNFHTNQNNFNSNQSSLINIHDNNNKNNNIINISSSNNIDISNGNIIMHQNINFEAFLEIINLEPSILDWLCINIEKLKYFNKNFNHNYCCFS